MAGRGKLKTIILKIKEAGEYLRNPIINPSLIWCLIEERSFFAHIIDRLLNLYEQQIFSNQLSDNQQLHKKLIPQPISSQRRLL
ncbi:hypothetical protein [Bartonella australis]|uniref:hypothetical protein n=1 Tax=Bartonella australis TaxID=388640 RepID=UPI0003489505|nr:hypothetical protein [Bartonella australis]